MFPILLCVFVTLHFGQCSSDLENRLSKLEKLVHAQSDYIIKLESELEMRDGDIRQSVNDKISNWEQRLLNCSEIKEISKGKRLLQETFQTTSFYAYISNYMPSVEKGHILIFDTVKVNINNGFSGNTGVFHAPVSGTYVFTYSIRITNGHYGAFEIVRNGNPEGVAIGILTANSIDQEQVIDTVVVTANQGDEIYVRTHSTLTHSGGILSNSDGRSIFAGWMISR